MWLHTKTRSFAFLSYQTISYTGIYKSFNPTFLNMVFPNFLVPPYVFHVFKVKSNLIFFSKNHLNITLCSLDQVN